jgi:hypothetical protein
MFKTIEELADKLPENLRLKFLDAYGVIYRRSISSLKPLNICVTAMVPNW